MEASRVTIRPHDRVPDAVRVSTPCTSHGGTIPGEQRSSEDEKVQAGVLRRWVVVPSSGLLAVGRPWAYGQEFLGRGAATKHRRLGRMAENQKDLGVARECKANPRTSRRKATKSTQSSLD